MSISFQNFATVEEVKRQFGRIAAELHPAVGGDALVFGQIVEAYQARLKELHGQVSIDDRQQEHKYFYDGVKEQALADKIGELLELKIAGGVVALVGTWIWVKGDTRPISYKLKALGLRYSGDKQMWYFHCGKFHKRSSKPAAWQNITAKYGYREFQQQKD